MVSHPCSFFFCGCSLFLFFEHFTDYVLLFPGSRIPDVFFFFPWELLFIPPTSDQIFEPTVFRSSVPFLVGRCLYPIRPGWLEPAMVSCPPRWFLSQIFH